MIDLQRYFAWISKNTLKHWMFAIFTLNTMAARQTSKQNIMIFLGLESNPKNLKKTAYIYIAYICYIYAIYIFIYTYIR